MNIRPFSKLLRRDGFVKDYDSRAGGQRVVIFQKTTETRVVDVQLWADGRHRASHGVRTKHGVSWHTTPTQFETPGGMLDAIVREFNRTDYPA